MEYWYLWLLLIVLCVITVFVLSKASAAAKKHNNERDALLREYDRKKALKDEFSFLTREKAESSDPETLFEGVSAVLQAKTEKAEDPEKVFGKFTETQKYIYTLYYFLEDTESDSLSFFFRNNGEPLTSLASKALCAVGENELSLIAEKEFSMYDENNEEVSVDKDEIEKLDGEFKAKLQKQQVLNSIKTYIIKNIDMLSRFGDILLRFLICLGHQLPYYIRHQHAAEDRTCLAIERYPLFRNITAVCGANSHTVYRKRKIILQLFRRTAVYHTVIEHNGRAKKRTRAVFSVLHGIGHIKFLAQRASCIDLT